MKEIKSFKEYIIEQKLFEDDEPGKDENDNDNSISLKTLNGFKTYPEGDDKYAKLDNLNHKLQILKHTYNSLNTIMDMKLAAPKNYNEKLNSAEYVLNITNGINLKSVYDKFKSSWEQEIEKWRDTQRDLGSLHTLKYNKSSDARNTAVDDLDKSSGEGKRFIDKHTNYKSNEISSSESNASDNDVQKEDVNIDEAFDIQKAKEIAGKVGNALKHAAGNTLQSIKANPFKTDYELASNSKGKYSAKNILTTAKWSKEGRRSDANMESTIGNWFNKYKSGIYGIDNKFFEDMYNDFKKRADGIIAKQRSYIEPDINSAERLIKNLYEKQRYVGDDTKYLTNISGYINSAYSQLISIGQSLKELVQNYQKSLNVLTRQYKMDAAKAKREFDSFDADTAIQKHLEGEVEKMNKQEAEEIEQQKKASDKANEKAKLEHEAEEIKKVHQRKEDYKNAIFDELKRFSEKRIEAVKSEANVNKNNSRGAKTEDQIKELKDQRARAFLLYAVLKKNKKLHEFSNLEIEYPEKQKKIFDEFYEDYFGENSEYLTLSNTELKKVANQIYSGKNDDPLPYKTHSEVEKEKVDSAKEKTEADKKKKPFLSKIRAAAEEKVGNAINGVRKKRLGRFNQFIDTRKLEGGEKNKKVVGEPAKDFDGEEPKSQPTSIYAYALQKAKEMK